MLITATCESKRGCGRPFRTIQGVMVEGIRTIVPEVDGRGDVREWIGYARERLTWERIVKNAETRERGDFRNFQDPQHAEEPPNAGTE